MKRLVIDPEESPLVKDWTVFLGVGTLLLAGLIVISWALGGEFVDLQTYNPPVTVLFYWACIFNEYLAPLLTGIVLLSTVVLLWVWTMQLARRIQRWPIKAAVGLSFLAASLLTLVLVAASLMGQLLVGYTHLSSAESDRYTYRLGVRTAMDGDNFYVVCQCGRLGLCCDCRGVASASDPYETWASAKLERDALSNSIHIKVGERIIPIER